jgi:acetyl esterase/lipase
VNKLLLSLLLFASLNSLYAQNLDPVSKWATIAAYEYHFFPNLVYKKANNMDLKLDVITAGPAKQARPTLIYIHGGGWVSASKEQTLLNTLPLLTRGMNVVTVEYRLGPQSLAPAAVEDCRCALRWVHQHAEEYGFDTTKLILEGHSAGGHLSLLTGMLDAAAGFDNECAGDETLKGGQLWPDNLRVAAIVNYFGVTDLTDLLQGPNVKWYAVSWFGSLPDRIELARKLSPLTYVRAGLPPIITLHGDHDDIVPYQHAVRLREALDRAGVPNELFTVPGGGHGGWTREENFRGQETVFRFLEKHGILVPQ